MLKKIGFLIFFFMFTMHAYDGYAAKKKKLTSTPLTVTQESPVAPTDKTTPTLAGLMTITTNYMWRGVTQTNNIAAFQGSVTATYPLRYTNFYANLWGSNVNFIDKEGSQAVLEMDTSIGITDTLWKNLYYNINFVRYNYPKAQGLSYNEFIVNVTYYFIKLMYGYSANEFNFHSPGRYYNAGVTFDLPKKYFLLDGLNLTATIGHFDLPKIVANSYNDYAITLSETVKSYVFALQWTGTNHRYLNNSQDANQLVGTISFNF